MEVKILLSKKPIILIFMLILFFQIYVAQNSIIPIYKLLIAGDLNNFRSSELYNFCYETKGVGLIFNNNSDISVMPKQIFTFINRYYDLAYNSLIGQIEIMPNGYYQYILIESNRPPETIHFILKDMGITFPLKELFFSLEDEEDFVYYFRFLSKDDQENIIIGKDLIELMDIKFIDNDNFIINNKDYISNVKEIDD